jgi:hypothetical protein
VEISEFGPERTEAGWRLVVGLVRNIDCPMQEIDILLIVAIRLSGPTTGHV